MSLKPYLICAAFAPIMSAVTELSLNYGTDVVSRLGKFTGSFTETEYLSRIRICGCFCLRVSDFSYNIKFYRELCCLCILQCRLVKRSWL